VPLPRPIRGLQCIRDFNRWISRDCLILFIIFYIFSVIVGFRIKSFFLYFILFYFHFSLDHYFTII